jgi:hypothetical protein
MYAPNDIVTYTLITSNEHLTKVSTDTARHLHGNNNKGPDENSDFHLAHIEVLGGGTRHFPTSRQKQDSKFLTEFISGRKFHSGLDTKTC